MTTPTALNKKESTANKKRIEKKDLKEKTKRPSKFQIEKLDERVVPDNVALHSDNNQI